MNVLLQEIQSIGGKLFLLEGALKLEAQPGTVSTEMLAEIKKHKQQIIAHLNQHKAPFETGQEHAPIIDGLHPCALCGGILFNEGDNGGYFCVECQPLPGIVTVNRVVRGITPRKPKKDTIYYEPSSAVVRKDKHRQSPIALAWLQEHRQALDDAGWTRSELYDRRKYRQGIAWLDLWEEAFPLAHLHEDGTIEFECSRHGRDYFQTAKPKRHEGKR